MICVGVPKLGESDQDAVLKLNNSLCLVRLSRELYPMCAGCNEFHGAGLAPEGSFSQSCRGYGSPEKIAEIASTYKAEIKCRDSKSKSKSKVVEVAPTKTVFTPNEVAAMQERKPIKLKDFHQIA